MDGDREEQKIETERKENESKGRKI